MAQLREWHPLRLRAASLAGLAGLMFGAMPAVAQVTPSENAERASEICRVFAVARSEAPVRDLIANCRGRGIMLGRVTEFEAIPNETLQATLIDARLGTERRVLLLSFQPDGSPLVEDLSGQIALAAGRGPMSELTGVEINPAGFARNGMLGVRGRAEDTGAAKADSIDLRTQIALARASSASAATTRD